jgi:ABC-type antimicrobial peptide transport system permease subunit
MVSAVKAAGAVSAITAVVHGVPTVGLEGDALQRFLGRTGVRKVSARDLPIAMAGREDGATTVAASLGLVLAAVGVYGVTAFGVGLQRREIGVRLALGAQPRREVARVVGRAIVAPLWGLVFGGAASALAAVAVKRFLVTVRPADPTAWAGAAALLLLAGLAAAAIPARRAAAIDPVRALRSE